MACAHTAPPAGYAGQPFHDERYAGGEPAPIYGADRSARGPFAGNAAHVRGRRRMRRPMPASEMNVRQRERAIKDARRNLRGHSAMGVLELLPLSSWRPPWWPTFACGWQMWETQPSQYPYFPIIFPSFRFSRTSTARCSGSVNFTLAPVSLSCTSMGSSRPLSDIKR